LDAEEERRQQEYQAARRLARLTAAVVKLQRWWRRPEQRRRRFRKYVLQRFMAHSILDELVIDYLREDFVPALLAEKDPLPNGQFERLTFETYATLAAEVAREASGELVDEVIRDRVSVYLQPSRPRNFLEAVVASLVQEVVAEEAPRVVADAMSERSAVTLLLLLTPFLPEWARCLLGARTSKC
jgi:hypothetical protein